jgi:betaine lipid synthase
MKFQQDIQYLPLSVRLGLIPITLICVYFVQLQTRVFTFFSNEKYQSWAMTWIYLLTASITCVLVAWDQLQIPVKFMYSCFFKRIGDHGNDQQSRLESFYQDQAKSKSIAYTEKVKCFSYFF